MSDIMVVARLLAHESGTAVRITRERGFPASARPMVLVPIEMAGESPSLFAMGIGDGVGTPAFEFCAEPRNRTQQYDFLERCVGHMMPFIEDWDRDPELLPQIVTSSRKASVVVLQLLDFMHFRATRPLLRQIARRLHLLDGCYEQRDSAYLLDLPSHIGRLYATGQDEQADQHLAALLQWLRPADGGIHDRVRKAEAISASTSTDPELDNQYLSPLAEMLRKARLSGKEEAAEWARDKIGEFLLAEVMSRHSLIRMGLSVLREFPESAAADDIREADRERYDNFRTRFVASDKKLGRGLKGHFGQVKFLERELAESRIEALEARSVSGARAAARLKGEHLVGTVVGHQTSINNRRLIVEYEIRSEQDVLSLREGDELDLLDGKVPFRFEIVEVEDGVGYYLVRAHLAAKKRSKVQPQVGDTVELGKPVPSRERINRTRRSAWKRYKDLQPRPTVTGPVPQSEDLLSVVRSLRGR